MVCGPFQASSSPLSLSSSPDILSLTCLLRSTLPAETSCCLLRGSFTFLGCACYLPLEDKALDDRCSVVII